MPPSKEDDPRRRQDEESWSSSSWFSSWFERDMRDEIHEQLNALDERKKQYEQAQEERRKFLQQHAASSSAAFPFPFFFPPEHDDNNNSNSNRNSNSVPRVDDRGQWDDFEEFLGGRIPRPRWEDHGAFDGDGGDQRRGRSPWDSDARENRQRDQESIEDLHREMQQMFEAAFGGGMMPPQGGTRSGSWTSSSTVVSSSNGTSYTMKQDSKNGARVDLQLPKNCQSENLSLEVLRDSPCLIRWKNHNHKDDDDATRSRHGRSPNEQVLELGNSVDCSRLSASISEAQRTLTVRAPPRGTGGGEEDKGPLSLKPNSYPRPVRVTKKQ